MKKLFLSKKIIFFISMLVFTAAGRLFCAEQNKVDYYGVFSPDADKNMIKMTEDLFFTQLNEMELLIKDQRNPQSNTSLSVSEIDFSSAQKDAFSFYVEIKRKGDALSKWNFTIFLKNNSNENISSFNKEYDSYYKILMESKSHLKEIFTDLLASNTDKKEEVVIRQSPAPQINVAVEKAGENSQNLLSTLPESISGTWQGENYIDKIVILKGGRGFIILKNGASMNVSITTFQDKDGLSTFLIKQKSHSNASYFPELPRNKALEVAIDAPPIEYTLKLVNNDLLEGTKKTLLQDDSTNEIQLKELQVIWKKNN